MLSVFALTAFLKGSRVNTRGTGVDSVFVIYIQGARFGFEQNCKIKNKHMDILCISSFSKTIKNI